MSIESQDLNLIKLRLQAAYLLAESVQHLWPEVKFGLSEINHYGFSYDFDNGSKGISSKDFKRIEKTMEQIVSSKEPVNVESVQRQEVIAWLQDKQQRYLLEHYQKVAPDEKLAFYRRADFCLPIILENDFTFETAYYKILTIGGAYWQDKADQAQLQRLHVAVYASNQELQDYLKKRKEKASVDHREIGKRHDLFMISDAVGKGLPILLEKGAIIRRQMENFIIEEETKRGYAHVYTPDLTDLNLYRRSGHYDHYRDSMYPPMKIDGQELILRPMSCPHHFQIYKRRPHSYRELPVRIAELAQLYRYEQSGELSGLRRGRTFTLADAHIICRPDQVDVEIKQALDLIEHVGSVFGLQPYRDYSYRLSLGDRQDSNDKYFKDDLAWDKSEELLRRVLQETARKFTEAKDEAAFYGPKIDIQMKYGQDNEDTAFTVQYDFVMPKKFDLKYVDKDNQLREAVVVHRSSIGAIDRVMAFLIEHYRGCFPVWLSPYQIRIATVNDSLSLQEQAQKMQQQAISKDARLRVNIDDSPKSVSGKIRKSLTENVPYTIVLGNKEVQAPEAGFKVTLRPDLEKSSSLKPDKAHTWTAILDTVIEQINKRQ